jgi:DNA-binding XRE family transcriptional regulator
MRRNIKIPRILKINWIKGLTISVVFNNGESRIIDFKKVLKKLELKNDSPILILKDSDEFAKVELSNNTLSWSNVEQYITGKNNKKVKAPFEIGADVLLKYSSSEVTGITSKIGRLVRDTRIKSGLTQKELAIKSGTSRNYISRIENDRSDIELDTLRKIIETGLGKHLEINVK